MMEVSCPLVWSRGLGIILPLSLHLSFWRTAMWLLGRGLQEPGSTHQSSCPLHQFFSQQVGQPYLSPMRMLSSSTKLPLQFWGGEVKLSHQFLHPSLNRFQCQLQHRPPPCLSHYWSQVPKTVLCARRNSGSMGNARSIMIPSMPGIHSISAASTTRLWGPKKLWPTITFIFTRLQAMFVTYASFLQAGRCLSPSICQLIKGGRIIPTGDVNIASKCSITLMVCTNTTKFADTTPTRNFSSTCAIIQAVAAPLLSLNAVTFMKSIMSSFKEKCRQGPEAVTFSGTFHQFVDDTVLDILDYFNSTVH